MIFSDVRYRQTLDGTKTQTRRPEKRGDIGVQSLDGTFVVVYRGNRKLWEIGHRYAVQPKRGAHSGGTFELVRIRREHAEMISDEDVVAEGFATKEEFLAVIHKLYGTTDKWMWCLDYGNVVVDEGIHA